MFHCWCFFSFLSFLFLFSPQDLRAPSADWCETLPRDQKCVQFYNLGPKIWGLHPLPPKKSLGKEGAKIWCNFGQLQTLTANISGVGGYIQNRQSNVWQCMLTYARTTLCRIMQLLLGHVALLQVEFQPLRLSPQSNLRRQVASCWTLPKISIYDCLRGSDRLYCVRLNFSLYAK